MDSQQVLFEVRARTVVKVLTIVLAAFALVEVLSAARDVLILLGVSLFLAVALNPAVVLVQRWLPARTGRSFGVHRAAGADRPVRGGAGRARHQPNQ